MNDDKQNGVNAHDGGGPPSETAAQVEEDIEGIRGRLGDIAGELDRRRHRAFDLSGQLVKPLAVGAAALTALGLGIWWWRSRARNSVRGRALALLPRSLTSGAWFDEVRKRAAEAIRPAPPIHPVRTSLLKISTAGAAAVASVLGKHVAGQVAAGRWSAAPTPAPHPPAVSSSR